MFRRGPRTIDARLLRRWRLPVPDDADKNVRGRVFIIAGSPAMPGAAVLAATAALRAGAGTLRIGVAESVAPLVGVAILEAMVVAFAQTGDGAIAEGCGDAAARHAAQSDALLIGPGMAEPPACDAFVVATLSRANVPAVVDAAALAPLRDRPELLHRLAGRAVLTPHAGEMAMLLGRKRTEVERHAERCAEEAARRFAAVVVLKGASTLIVTPEGERYVHTGGPVGLATSGSGDTLAGVIAGLLARGAPPLVAAAWGVHAHAGAGAVLQRKIGMGFLARELLAEIPPLLRS
jgi:ADP-dependent NAD(P)H-hydrate dehydratase